jgi:hypothetical protein
MMLGSSIFVSAFVVNIRSRAFEQKFKEVIEQPKLKRDRKRKISTNFLLLPFSRINSAARPNKNQPEREPKSPLSQGEASTSPGADYQPHSSDGTGTNDHRSVEADLAGIGAGQNGTKVTVDTAIQGKLPYKGEPTLSNADSHSEPNVTNPVKSTMVALPLGGTILQPQHKDPNSVLFSTHGVGARFAHIALPHIHQPSEELGSSPYLQNSETAHLSHLERLRLGGVEYRATRMLVWVVPAYFVLWQLFGCIGLGAWITINRPGTARSNGLNPFWAGAFNAVSAFNNNGYSLIDANMAAFHTSDYMLITMSLLILAGNTCYPIFLRLILWVFLKLTPEDWTEDKESLRFLLDHPRRCYTNLFPTNDTWWLLLAVITLDGIDWAGFLVFNVSPHPLPFS